MVKKGFGLIGLIVTIGLVAVFTVGSYYFWSASYNGTGPFTATSTSIIDVGINAKNEALELKKKLEERGESLATTSAPSNSQNRL